VTALPSAEGNNETVSNACYSALAKITPQYVAAIFLHLNYIDMVTPPKEFSFFLFSEGSQLRSEMSEKAVQFFYCFNIVVIIICDLRS